MNLDEELRTTFVSESERREPPLVDAHGILARGQTGGDGGAPCSRPVWQRRWSP